MLNVYCVAAALFGVLIGYVFAWSTRRNEPNAMDVAGLLATIVGGSIITMLSDLQCPERTALYLIGLVIGYVVYLIVLKYNYREIDAAYRRGDLQPSPLFPWRVKQLVESAPCDCCTPPSVPRRRTETPLPSADDEVGIVAPLPATQVGSPVGIDVSRWQGTIDWTKVRAAGYSFAFIKATEGAHWLDPNFMRNRENARKAGLYTGAYHFFRPKVLVEAQIINFVNKVGSLQNGDLPPVLDIEVPEEWVGIPQEERIQSILKWLTEVHKRLGVKPIVYCSPSFAQDVLKHDPRLRDYQLWLAHYTGASRPRLPAPWTYWVFWQHSETGGVPGISGDVDLNRFHSTAEELARMARR